MTHAESIIVQAIEVHEMQSREGATNSSLAIDIVAALNAAGYLTDEALKHQSAGAGYHYINYSIGE